MADTTAKTLTAKADPEELAAASQHSDSDESDFDIESELELIENPITAADLYTKPRYMGMPATYLAVGVIYGGQAAILFPLYQLILESPQNYQNSLRQSVSLFWSFKIFYGFLSDSVPIFKKRRKPYILGGWAISFLTTAIQAIYVGAFEDTRYCYYDAPDGDFPRKEVGAEEECPPGDTELYYTTVSVSREGFNQNGFAALMILTNFSYMFADVAADGLAVQYAHREPANERGRIQSYNYVMRFVTSTFTIILSGFALNTPLYGGDYQAGLDMSTYLWILAIGQGIWLPLWVIMEDEDADPKTIVPVSEKVKQAWHLLQNRAFSGLMVFNVMFNCFSAIGVYAPNGLSRYWVGVDNLQNSLAIVFVYVAITLTIYINGRYFTNYSWRCLQSFGLITSTIMGLLSLLIIFNITRNPWFWIFTQIDSAVLSMIGWLTSIWAVNEMAPPGLEGTALALATTSSNAALGLSSYLGNAVGAFFPELAAADSSAEFNQPIIEEQYAYNLFIVLALNMIALLFMWLLPYQKAEAKRRYETWGSSLPYAFLGLGIICIAMFYGTVSNLFTLFCPCKKSWGGPGCIEGTCDPLDEAGNATRLLL